MATQPTATYWLTSVLERNSESLGRIPLSIRTASYSGPSSIAITEIASREVRRRLRQEKTSKRTKASAE
jgi:hypothetical protein